MEMGIRTIIMGNPQPQSPPIGSHIYPQKAKKTLIGFVRRVTYLDILDFVNDFDLREITFQRLQISFPLFCSPCPFGLWC